MIKPNPIIAKDSFEKAMKLDVSLCEQFQTGIANYVFDVTTINGQKYVVKMNSDNSKNLAGEKYWIDILAQFDIRIPTILFEDLEGWLVDIPFLIMDYIPGTDLGYEYKTLSKSQKKKIAFTLATIQKQVGQLPLGKGFGYVAHYDDNYRAKNMRDLIESSLDLCTAIVKKNGFFDIGYYDTLKSFINAKNEYLENIKPTPFLDDITTKNVLIENGELQGIVDLDNLCFGDPMWHVSLTKMALLSDEADLDYIDYWLEAMEATQEERIMVEIYTAIHCVCFMREMGEKFNKDVIEPINPKRITLLEKILKDQIEIINKGLK